MPSGFEDDLSAILNTINSAKEFVHVAVMDYAASTEFTPVKRSVPVMELLHMRMISVCVTLIHL